MVGSKYHSHGDRSEFRMSTAERKNFMSSKIGTMYSDVTPNTLSSDSDFKGEEEDFRKFFKVIEHLGSSQMKWKERKKLENQRVVSLGGKPKKHDKVPLPLAKCIMKKQQKREKKLLQEGLLDPSLFKKQKETKDQSRRPEDRALMITQGRFRNGELNVKHMLEKDKTASERREHSRSGNDKRKGKGKKHKGKKKWKR